MAVEFTDEQKLVIQTRNKNILVSAAAGSGKTAVLTERIIKKMTEDDPKVGIDHLLIV
ncbi:MAG: UvrD-helicase domain-containing protein, partial [Lachnospiraceae bacterium]|nr:UvrD-helicase domain-containing protein [Lachnospiraceae bacterium]